MNRESSVLTDDTVDCEDSTLESTEPELSLAVQCATLMLWSFANELLANWARSKRGLPERGAYLPWLSEAAIDINLADINLGVLRQDVLRLGDALPVRERRRRRALEGRLVTSNDGASRHAICGEIVTTRRGRGGGRVIVQIHGHRA